MGDQRGRLARILDCREFTHAHACVCVCVFSTVESLGNELPPGQVKQQQGHPHILGRLGHYI